MSQTTVNGHNLTVTKKFYFRKDTEILTIHQYQYTFITLQINVKEIFMIVMFVTILLLLNKYVEYYCVITRIFTAICFFKLEVSPIPVWPNLPI